MLRKILVIIIEKRYLNSHQRIRSTMKSKTAIIINPQAGRGKCKKKWPEIKSIIESQDIDFESYFTKAPGHASILAKDLETQGFTRIVVMGGDGTFHEVVNGLDAARVALGIIPAGTGNDFCRSVGIPLNPQITAQTLFKGRVIHVDLGCVNDRLFVNVAGVGFDARVAEEVNKNVKLLTGTSAYLFALFKLVVSYRNIALKVVLDNNIDLKINSFLLAIGNGRYYGGGMCIVPSALVNDGFFHICVAGDFKKIEVLTTLPKIFSGKHLEHPKVREYKAQAIEVFSDSREVVHADGEIVSCLPAKFSILPGKLKLLLPKLRN